MKKKMLVKIISEVPAMRKCDGQNGAATLDRMSQVLFFLKGAYRLSAALYILVPRLSFNGCTSKANFFTALFPLFYK